MSISSAVPISDSPRENASVAKQAVVSTLRLSSEELALMQSLHGDANAFNELVLKYQQLAFSVAMRILQSSEAAEDVVQDSFIKAFCALHSFRGGSFKSWLMPIVVNNCYDLLRRNRHLAMVEIYDEPDDEDGTSFAPQLVDTHELPQAFVENLELNTQIESGIRNLPSEQRTDLVLRNIHGYSYTRIAMRRSVRLQDW